MRNESVAKRKRKAKQKRKGLKEEGSYDKIKESLKITKTAREKESVKMFKRNCNTFGRDRREVNKRITLK